MQALPRWQREIGHYLVEPADRKRLVTFSAEFAFLDRKRRQRTCSRAWSCTKVFRAAGVQSKAVNEPVVKFVKDVLDRSGYEGENICFKSDQEVSIIALKRAVAAARGRNRPDRISSEGFQEQRHDGVGDWHLAGLGSDHQGLHGG